MNLFALFALPGTLPPTEAPAASAGDVPPAGAFEGLLAALPVPLAPAEPEAEGFEDRAEPDEAPDQAEEAPTATIETLPVFAVAPEAVPTPHGGRPTASLERAPDTMSASDKPEQGTVSAAPQTAAPAPAPALSSEPTQVPQALARALEALHPRESVRATEIQRGGTPSTEPSFQGLDAALAERGLDPGHPAPARRPRSPAPPLAPTPTTSVEVAEVEPATQDAPTQAPEVAQAAPAEEPGPTPELSAALPETVRIQIDADLDVQIERASEQAVGVLLEGSAEALREMNGIAAELDESLASGGFSLDDFRSQEREGEASKKPASSAHRPKAEDEAQAPPPPRPRRGSRLDLRA